MNRCSNWFRKYFIPHEANEHQPHSLREGSAVVVLFLVVLIEVAVIIPSFFVLPKSDYLAAVLSGALTDLTNETRLEARLPALATNSLLTQAAQLKAEDMAARGYFAHYGPNGELPWSWLNLVGYQFSAAGENLAVNFFDSQDVVKAWLQSETHKANLLRDNFSEIGIGVASGRYQGRNSIYVVQFFGRPSVGQDGSSSGSQVLSSVIPEPRLQQVLGAAVEVVDLSTWERLSIRLHTLSDAIYLTLLSLLIVALLLNFFVKIRIQHPHLLVNGLMLILLISIALFVNQQLFERHLKTSYLDTISAR